MEQTVPWSKLIALIEQAYPTSGRRGRQPMPLANMLRIHCIQNWFSSSDRQMEDALYEIESAALPVLVASLKPCRMRPQSSTFVICWRNSNYPKTVRNY